jgi:hypothetical protein
VANPCSLACGEQEARFAARSSFSPAEREAARQQFEAAGATVTRQQEAAAASVHAAFLSRAQEPPSGLGGPGTGTGRVCIALDFGEDTVVVSYNEEPITLRQLRELLDLPMADMRSAELRDELMWCV